MVNGPLKLTPLGSCHGLHQRVLENSKGPAHNCVVLAGFDQHFLVNSQN